MSIVQIKYDHYVVPDFVKLYQHLHLYIQNFKPNEHTITVNDWYESGLESALIHENIIQKVFKQTNLDLGKMIIVQETSYIPSGKDVFMLQNAFDGEPHYLEMFASGYFYLGIDKDTYFKCLYDTMNDDNDGKSLNEYLSSVVEANGVYHQKLDMEKQGFFLEVGYSKKLTSTIIKSNFKDNVKNIIFKVSNDGSDIHELFLKLGKVSEELIKNNYDYDNLSIICSFTENDGNLLLEFIGDNFQTMGNKENYS